MPPRRRTRNETPPVDGDEGASSGLANTLEQFFRQFNPNLGSRIDYDKARKNGAQQFTHAEEPMDAHNWIENMERVFTQIGCPEELKVNLAVQFLQRGAWHWWTETRRGMGVEADQMSWDQFSTLFRGRYISQAHLNRMREEFLNLEKGDMTVMVYEQRFLELAHYVPDLVKTEQDRIYQFIRGLGGMYADSMAAVPYMSFSQAALNIEARGLSTGPPSPLILWLLTALVLYSPEYTTLFLFPFSVPHKIFLRSSACKHNHNQLISSLLCPSISLSNYLSPFFTSPSLPAIKLSITMTSQFHKQLTTIIVAPIQHSKHNHHPRAPLHRRCSPEQPRHLRRSSVEPVLTETSHHHWPSLSSRRAQTTTVFHLSSLSSRRQSRAHRHHSEPVFDPPAKLSPCVYRS